MFDHFHDGGFRALPANASCGALRAFFENHREAIANAAQLLGGEQGARLARGLAEELSSGAAISRRCRRRLGDLLDLLTLEHVADPDRDEAAFVAMIDPASPAVEEICRLTDLFRDALDQAAPHWPRASRSRIGA